MNSTPGDWTQLQPGSPIRTPWDHSSVGSSPRPIAASHVLHRPLVPRHPPSALSHLTTNKQLRCSHPLYKSQQTTPTTTTTPPHEAADSGSTTNNPPQAATPPQRLVRSQPDRMPSSTHRTPRHHHSSVTRAP